MFSFTFGVLAIVLIVARLLIQGKEIFIEIGLKFAYGHIDLAPHTAIADAGHFPPRAVIHNGIILHIRDAVIRLSYLFIYLDYLWRFQCHASYRRSARARAMTRGLCPCS